MNTIKEISNQFKKDLTSLYTENELNQMFRIIMEQEFDLSAIDLLTNDKELSTDQVRRTAAIKEELLESKPLAQILGQWEFLGLPVVVNEHVLIPRPETEELVNLVLLENSTTRLDVLDIGTGTGCIPIALKKKRTSWNLFGFDVSHKALKVAVQNGILNNVDVHWEEFDVLKGRKHAYEQQFDLIISNPPYIPLAEKNDMDASVVEFEPALALFVSDEAPLFFYEAILEFAKTNLKRNGKVYFEVHHALAQQVGGLVQKMGFENVRVVKDINEKERMVTAQLVD